MQQSEVTTDEEAEVFLRQWAREPGRFADSNLQSSAFQTALNNYQQAHAKRANVPQKTVQEALQQALSLAQA